MGHAHDLRHLGELGGGDLVEELLHLRWRHAHRAHLAVAELLGEQLLLDLVAEVLPDLRDRAAVGLFERLLAAELLRELPKSLIEHLVDLVGLHDDGRVALRLGEEHLLADQLVEGLAVDRIGGDLPLRDLLGHEDHLGMKHHLSVHDGDDGVEQLFVLR